MFDLQLFCGYTQLTLCQLKAKKEEKKSLLLLCFYTPFFYGLDTSVSIMFSVGVT